MKKIIYTFFTFAFLLLHLLHSQPVTLEWARRYNEPGNMNDNTISLALDKSGNVVVTGFCQTSTQSTNIVTVKYSPSGVQQWAVPFNYQSNVTDEPDAMVIDTAGNIYIAASCGSFFTEIYDCVLLKYKPTGTLEWYRGYGNFTGAFAAKDLIIDRQGYIYVAGNTNVPTPNSIFLLKYSPTGDTIWTRKYKEPSYNINYAETIALDSSNNIIIGGSCNVNSNFSGDCLVIKYFSNGNFSWSATYNSGGANTSDVVRRIGVDNSGNIYTTGHGNYSADFLTLKYNSTGIFQWFKTYNGYGSGSDYATSLVIDKGGNIIITGTSRGPTSSYNDYATIKYNQNGDSLWVKRYNGTGSGGGDAFDLDIDDSSNVYVTGYKIDTISTVKYNSSGFQQSVAQYHGGLTQLFVGRRIKVDSQRNVYVIGNNSDSGTGSDYITIKYSQLVGIKPIANSIPKEFALLQNYPNPFNPKTNINYELPISNYVKLAIYDILGRELAVLVNEKQNAGKYKIEWNGSNYPSGVYFYRLIADKNIFTKKMILAK